MATVASTNRVEQLTGQISELRQLLRRIAGERGDNEGREERRDRDEERGDNEERRDRDEEPGDNEDRDAE